MRPILKASISFGLVNVPIKFYSATEDHAIKAHQVHQHDGGRISYARVCKDCGEVVENRDIAKQYETEGGGTVILTEDDLATLHEDDNRQVEVLEFVPASQINPLMFDASYYLEPDGAGKAYALLAKTIGSTDQVAIVRFSMRSKTHLAALRVVGKGDVLAIQTLRWADELREPDFPSIKPVEVNEAEVQAAAAIIASKASETFNPDKYRDAYRDELRELIAAKAVDTDENGTEEVADLLAKLQASVPKKRGRKKAAPELVSA